VTAGRPLRMVALNSAYRVRGGEDEAYAVQIALLRECGHEVVELTRSAATLAAEPAARRAARVVWNTEAATALAALLRRYRPQVAYLNNTFPALSASTLAVLARHGVPAVLPVHNYRLACVTGLAYRDGASCLECVGRAPLGALRHGCYHGRGASAVAVPALLAMRAVLARHPGLVRFLPFSAHLRAFLLRIGFQPDQIAAVTPQTVLCPPEPVWTSGAHILLAGRLEPEKGLAAALDAVRATAGLRLLVAGGGSELDRLRAAGALSGLDGRVELLGRLPPAEVLRLMSTARATLVPSLWDEPYGRVAMESLACGTPVLAADRGGLREIPEHGVSGLLVDPADPAALAAALDRVWREDWWATGGRVAARARFDEHHSPAVVRPLLDRAVRAAAALRGRADATPSATQSSLL
jgi:glycosyltransferase involved in cell wall biosynthesis